MFPHINSCSICSDAVIICRLRTPVDARAHLAPHTLLTAIALPVSMFLTANASCARVVSSSPCRTLPSWR